VMQVVMENVAKHVVHRTKGSFAREEVFYIMCSKVVKVMLVFSGECSNKTGRCLCAQFPGSTLISGYYGDACEFVRYNRSGVSAFSTSVQSASKLAKHKCRAFHG
jgi:hypothetical protein